MREIVWKNDGSFDVFGVITKNEFESWKNGRCVYNINTYCIEKLTSAVENIMNRYEDSEYFTYDDWCDLCFWCVPYKDGIALYSSE